MNSSAQVEAHRIVKGRSGQVQRYRVPPQLLRGLIEHQSMSGKILDYVKFETGNLVMISPSASFFGETELEKCMEFR